MKKYIYCFLIFCTLIISYVVFSIHKEKIEIIQFCTQASNFKDVDSCRYNNDINYQQKYDMYYRNADKIYNDFFYGGFDDAYQNCAAHEPQCNLHNPMIFYQLEKKCAEYGGYNCTSALLKHWKIEDKNYYIKIFEKSVLMNKHCISETFFESLTSEDKSKINPEVLKICERE